MISIRSLYLTRFNTSDPSYHLLTQWMGWGITTAAQSFFRGTSVNLSELKQRRYNNPYWHKFHNCSTTHYLSNGCHTRTIFPLTCFSSSRCLRLSLKAAFNQRRQVNSQWPVVIIITSHTWRAIVMTTSSCLLGLDILLITFHLELPYPLCWML